MLKEIKEEMLDNPDSISELLESFDFAHIHISPREIRFARDEFGGQNISIRLNNNKNLYVNDFARGINKDIFQYIIQEKNVTFKDVIQETKRILNLADDWCPRKKITLFGGVYDNIINPHKDMVLKTYDESILDQYVPFGNQMFLDDGISLVTQRFWNIRFSIEDNAIIIPIYNEYGELVGAKARINKKPEDGESKYYYPIQVSASQTLYGYSNNYQYLFNNDVILVESEKAVMQAFTFGVRNIVGIGSHSISEKQVKLLLQLQPKRIIIAMDEGLEFSQTQRNVDVIKVSYSSMFSPEIWYWDSGQDLDILPKASPTDMGREKFEEIMNEQLVRIY